MMPASPARMLLAIAVLWSLLPAAEAQRRGVRSPSAAAGPLDERIQLSAWGGWQFGGGMSNIYVDPQSPNVDLSTPADVNFGAALMFRAQRDKLVGLVWNQQQTLVKVTNRGLFPDSTLFDMTVHYVHLGAEVERGTDRVRGFGMGSLGLTIFDPESDRYGSSTRFSLGAGLGAKAYASERMGIRAQLRGWMTLVGAGGGGMWCGPGGCSVSVGAYGYFQGDVSGGLFLTF